MPIGPWPITSTVSPFPTRALRTAFRQVFTGSTNVASSKLTSSGSAIIPRSTIQGMARTYSPKPPPLGSPSPAVSPVFLYPAHCENNFCSQ